MATREQQRASFTALLNAILKEYISNPYAGNQSIKPNHSDRRHSSTRCILNCNEISAAFIDKVDLITQQRLSHKIGIDLSALVNVLRRIRQAFHIFT